MFNHILVPLDGSPLAECVLPHLIGMAQPFGAQITILRVLQALPDIDSSYPMNPMTWEIRKAEAEAYLKNVVLRLGEAEITAKPVLLEGDAASQIKEFADKEKFDLIILSSHGQSGLSRWNVSSIVHKVIQRANRSILLIRAYDEKKQQLQAIHYRKILVPLDGSQRAEILLGLMETMANFHEARLFIAHVVLRPQMLHKLPLKVEDREFLDRFVCRNQQRAAQYLDDLHNRLSWNFESYLPVSSDVALTLHELVDEQDVDLVIMSAHGYSGQSRWPYGSITSSFIEYGSKPLLIVQDLEAQDVATTKAETFVTESKGH